MSTTLFTSSAQAKKHLKAKYPNLQLVTEYEYNQKWEWKCKICKSVFFRGVAVLNRLPAELGGCPTCARAMQIQKSIANRKELGKQRALENLSKFQGRMRIISYDEDRKFVKMICKKCETPREGIVPHLIKFQNRRDGFSCIPCGVRHLERVNAQKRREEHYRKTEERLKKVIAHVQEHNLPIEVGSAIHEKNGKAISFWASCKTCGHKWKANIWGALKYASTGCKKCTTIISAEERFASVRKSYVGIVQTFCSVEALEVPSRSGSIIKFRCTVCQTKFDSSCLAMKDGISRCPRCKPRKSTSQKPIIGRKCYKVRIRNRVFEVEGYERLALHWLVEQGVRPKDIEKLEIAPENRFYFKFRGKMTSTYPDFYLKSSDTFIEVKGSYTAGMNFCSKKSARAKPSLRLNLLKTKARKFHQNGLKYRVLLVLGMDRETQRVRAALLPVEFYQWTPTQIQRWLIDNDFILR